jgi:hypothetical protein
MASELIERIQRNLISTHATLWGSLNKLMQRGETAERLELVAIVLAESSKAFDVDTERHVATPWQRCCGRGRWVQWVFPCIPIWQWLRNQFSTRA